MVDTTELEAQFFATAEALHVSLSDQASIFSLLSPLKGGPPAVAEHYAHSLRVGLLAAKIAAVALLPAPPLFIAGTLHDVGKSLIPFDVLGKTSDWTKEDTLIMRNHVMLGYNLLRSRFPLAADIMVWHHRYQPDPYPDTIPPFAYSENDGLVKHIVTYGRLLALADCYDAMHRKNSKYGAALTGIEIKKKMFLSNTDKTSLLTNLYRRNIFSEE
jgi:response regulator RpfG family c-di-GMP phosphodiesterase